MDIRDRITVRADQRRGRPCVRGMRIRLKDVLDLFASGNSHEQNREDFPYLESAEIEARLRFAAHQLEDSILESAPTP